MPDKFLNRYRISSARLSNWDYSSNAAYFLTICTANRQNYFGEIINSEMHFSKIGEYANECWVDLPTHFPYFYLDEFTIMPNHIHGIVLIERPYYVETRHGAETKDFRDITHVVGRGDIVETRHALSLQDTDPTQPVRHFRFRNQGKNTISAMVGSFKSAVTKRCNKNNLAFGWQSRFYDHIIRDKHEFNIRTYIINNPKTWKEDRFYS